MKGIHHTALKLNQFYNTSKVLPVSYPVNSPRLLASVQELGIITPLLVQPLSESKYQVICGHRRLVACQSLGLDTIPCHVLVEPVNDLQVLLLNLHDNLVSRAFNPIEQSLIINKLEIFLSSEQVVRNYLPLLGLNPHAKIKDKLAPLANLEDAIKQAVVKETLHADVAYRLSCFSTLERQALFGLLSKLHLSTSKQQELIANLEAIKHRENTTIEQLLADPGIQNVADNQELSLNQRGEQIRQLIHQRHSPLYSQAQQEFIQYKKELGLPPNINLTPPAFFERDDYKLSFFFSSPEDLKRRLVKLEQLADTSALKQIMKLGKKL